MTSPIEVNGSSDLNRGVLQHAWAQLSVFDQTASDLKQQFLRRRYLVVGLTLTATIASVVIGLVGETPLAVFLGIVAITLPIIGSYIMADVIRFTGTTDWIRNRYTTEMMRMHIYLYRMQAGIYATGPTYAMDDLLVEKLSEVIKEHTTDKRIPASATAPKDEPSTIKVIKTANSLTPDDDGFSKIAIEDYVKWRIDGQRNWYDSKIRDDFRRLKIFFRAAQIFLLFGALLGVLAGIFDIQFVALIAITNSTAAALTLWSDLDMVGKAYGLFMIASDQLSVQKGNWIAFQNNPEFQEPEKHAAKALELVQHVENILLWERQEWRELAIQSQATSDEMILGDLERLTTRAQEAQS